MLYAIGVALKRPKKKKESYCSSGHFGDTSLTSSLVQWVKDLALLQLWCRLQLRFDLWRGNFHVPSVKKKKKKKKKEPNLCQTSPERIANQ